MPGPTNTENVPKQRRPSDDPPEFEDKSPQKEDGHIGAVEDKSSTSLLRPDGRSRTNRGRAEQRSPAPRLESVRSVANLSARIDGRQTFDALPRSRGIIVEPSIAGVVFRRRSLYAQTTTCLGRGGK